MLKAIKAYFTSHKKVYFPVAIAAIVVGFALIWLGLQQTVTVVVDGTSKTVRTGALTPAGVLRATDVDSHPADLVRPARGRLIWNQNTIFVDSAVDVVLKTPDYEVVFPSAERVPANLLQEAEITLYPQDLVRVNGELVDPTKPLKVEGAFVLQFVPAIPLTLITDEDSRVIYTNQITLGAALETAGVALGEQDWVSMDLATALIGPLEVSIRPARAVTVQQGNDTFAGLSAALTVGEALQDIGLPLQNLDYSVPDEGATLPEDGVIRVVHGFEQLAIATDETAYESTWQEDPDTPLDQTSVIQPGQAAIYASRERTYYEDGEAVWRLTEDTWQASEATEGILGYGTDIVIQTEVVDGVTIEYWRKKLVYATSYKPCNDYTGECWDGTAGGYPLQKGIIAVMPWWYSVPEGLAMADLRVYVAGYGEAIIGDVCGGCSGGTPWIDLAYREENYVPWYHWTTMYFLTPVPDRYIPAIITP